MMLTPTVRAAYYNAEFHRYPDSQLQVGQKGFLSGVWMLGNNYKGSGFYGAYPPQYVKRVMALFPDAKKVMHLFSGSMVPGDYVRVDTGTNKRRDGTRYPDMVADAHNLNACVVSQFGKQAKFDLIVADPPYTKADAARYGTPMIHRKRVLEQCSLVLQPGGFVVWLDTVWPMIHKKHLVLVGAIGILRSQNHRVRFCFIM